jgi:osmotically-inducible protein OsmY
MRQTRILLFIILFFSCVACESPSRSDRRTLGMQTDDAAIELKAASLASKITGAMGRVTITSYNRMVLLTGEVVDEKMKMEVQKQIESINGVKSIENDLVIAPVSSLGVRANDALITGKVKTAIVDTAGLYVNAFKVQTDRSVVYLMGRVTEREAKLAGEVARNVGGGLRKVVLLFEYINENSAKEAIPKQAYNDNDNDFYRQREPFADERLRLEQQRKQQEQRLPTERGSPRQSSVNESFRFEEEKRQQRQAKTSPRINLKISATPPSMDGEYTISIETNTDTASLKINGEELGGTADGRYKVNRVARAGQDTKLDIIAKDVYGNTDSKTIIVSRTITDSKVSYAPLNPAQVERQTELDAVAIIIGIANYKTLPKADFANDDARVFYDYAIRALGVKPENIKLLVDADAEEVEIIKAFKTWLPSRVKSTTDVYVFYSGHGLPTQDGQGLYLLPPRADPDFISRTAIQFQEINSDLQAAKPKSVTIFMDACYSGQARSGETLVANARPVTLKAERKLFPDNFTVITASQADQISSSSPDLKHGIFSYYLMKGMEGEADTNKDGKITLGEMQAYLVENVGRQAGMMSRKQEPQLIGDAGRVLVWK